MAPTRAFVVMFPFKCLYSCHANFRYDAKQIHSMPPDAGGPVRIHPWRSLPDVSIIIVEIPHQPRRLVLHRR